MIGAVAAEAELVPTESVAVTVWMQATALVNPETVIGDEVLEPLKGLVAAVQVASETKALKPPMKKLRFWSLSSSFPTF